MKITIPVVIKKNNSWIMGKLDKGILKEETTFKSLKSVDNASKYISILKYLGNKGFNKEQSENIKNILLKKLKAESIYIYNIPMKMEPKDFELYFWSEYNTTCQKCKLTCKQSRKVILAYCPKFKEIK